MSTLPNSVGALRGVRVLDLTDQPGALCTKLLADLGADVIKIEPPGGDPARRFGPFYRGEADPEKSLFFWHYNTNKRSIVLDLAQPADQEIFRSLARTADLLVDSRPPGTLDAWGLGHAALRRENPALIQASITPYGQTGPRAHWKGNDLTAWAMGAVMTVCGEPDREPLRGVLGQAYHFASFGAAIALLGALHYQRATGEGNLIDVSLQEAVATFSESSTLFWIYNRQKAPRYGSGHPLAVPFAAFRCRDGWGLVAAITQQQCQTLYTWMAGDGKADDLLDEKYLPLVNRLAHRDHINALIADWTPDYTVDELFELGQAQSLPVGVVNTADRIARDPHLAARGFWTPVEHPELGETVTYPGAPYRFDPAGWRIRRRAPRLDEDRAAILAELDRGRLTVDRGPGTPNAGSPIVEPDPAPIAQGRSTVPGPSSAVGSGKPRPLDGVRIADFTWVLAGPVASRMLADLGADVIKVEQPVNGCLLRIFPPFIGGEVDKNKCAPFILHNRNKRSLVVDLRTEPGVEIAKRLVGWGDVVLENFSAGVMERLGLGYEDLRRVQPNLILVRMAGFGQTGPYADYVSYHATLTAMAGHTHVAGYPEGIPCGYGTSFADYFGGLSGAVATLAAIEYRRRTGRGVYVDLGQWEAVTTLLGPALLDYQVNGEVLGPCANRWVEAGRGPYGVYPCAGEDRWIALAAAEDAEWVALCELAERPEWRADPRFQTAADRYRHEAELDALIGAWTKTWADFELMERLQRAGVPAGVVQTGQDIVDRDVHIRDRGYWVRYDQPDVGPVTIDRGPAHFPETPFAVRRPAPKLGEHTRGILKDVLGYSPNEIDQLEKDGVVSAE